MRLYLFLLSFLAVFASSCKKEQNKTAEKEFSFSIEGVWTSQTTEERIYANGSSENLDFDPLIIDFKSDGKFVYLNEEDGQNAKNESTYELTKRATNSYSLTLKTVRVDAKDGGNQESTTTITETYDLKVTADQTIRIEHQTKEYKQRLILSKSVK